MLTATFMSNLYYKNVKSTDNEGFTCTYTLNLGEQTVCLDSEVMCWDEDMQLCASGTALCKSTICSSFIIILRCS